jgi:transglutaminase-like putative cysteine protease
VRFGLVHRIMTDALATLGLLALVTSGELNRWITVSVVVGLVLALAVPERWQDQPKFRQIGVVAPVVLLAAQIARLATGAPVLQLAVEFAAGLQVVRLATRRGAAHDQQVVVLALLHLIAGTVLGGGLAYGLCFLGFLVIAPGALVLSHLRREVEGNYRQGARDRTGLPVDVPRILRSRRVIGKQFLAFTCLLSVPIFLFTAILFVMFPRVGLSLLLLNHGRPERMIGFSDKVDLGGVGKLRSDPTIAMRVEPSDLPGNPPTRLALYLRGTAFDQYDGRSWSRSQNARTAADMMGRTIRLRRPPDPIHDRKLTIDLEPIDPPVMFITADATAVRLLGSRATLVGPQTTVLAGPEGELKYVSVEERGLRYEVFLPGAREPRPPPMAKAERARYLTLPPDLPQRVSELARTWTRNSSSDRSRAAAVEARLRKDYVYDLDSPSGAAANPLDDFLFESKRGHCEFYSTAMAILLRTQGVPTRNVTGFIGGTYNRFGNFYAVRQGDAHSWVEVYLDGEGWVRFDPTPPANAAPQGDVTGFFAFIRDFVEAAAQRWNRNVVGYDLKQQVSLFRTVRSRYMSIRGKSGISANISSPRRLALFAMGIGLALAGVYWLRRSRRSQRGPRAPDQKNDIAVLRAVALYRSLEAALAQAGVPRPPSVPPFAHAVALEALGHPLGAEARELTEIYLEARFGGRVLSEDEQRSFARRVTEMRKYREDAAA